MRGSQQDSWNAHAVQYVDACALGVDRDRWRVQPLIAQMLAGPEGSWVLHSYRGDPVVVQYVSEQAECLGGAGDDEYLVGVRPDCAVAGEPVGNGVTQCRCPARVCVSKVGRREACQYGAFGTQPR